MYKNSKNITMSTVVSNDEKYRYCIRDFCSQIALSYKENMYTEHTLQLISQFLSVIAKEYQQYRNLQMKPIYEYEYLSTFNNFYDKFKNKPIRRLNYVHFNDLCPNTFITNCQICISNTEIGEFRLIIQYILDKFYIYFRYLLKMDHVFETRNEYEQYLQVCKDYDIPYPPDIVYIKEENEEYMNYLEKRKKYYNKNYIKSFNNIEPLWPWKKNEGRHNYI